MPVAEAASAYVYEGIWTNWSKGRHIGATLTLSPTNALLLIAVIAIFIQISGTQLWRIVQFILHQIRATPEHKDGLYHQQQVILRNSSSELGALWSMVRVAIAWRTEKTVKSYRRSTPLMLVTILHFSVWALAGIFSSKLLDAGDQVLSRSPFCGVYNHTYSDSIARTADIAKPNQRVIESYATAQARYQQSQQYVQFCSDSGAACRELPQETIPWSGTLGYHCPFDPQVCSQDLNKSVIIDTGLISSHRHLGLNAPEADRIQYRKVTTCTILNDAKYISDWKVIPATADSPAKRVVDAYYGVSHIADRNSTYSHSEWSQYYSFDQYSNTNPYQINVQMADASDPTGLYSDFVPIPELVRADADIFLAFLSYSKVYEAPVKDPWFTAQRKTAYPTPDNINAINATVYERQRPVTTLACAEQYQLCIDRDKPSMSPDLGRCTPLAGNYATAVGPHSVDSLNLTAHQVAVATRVLTAAIDACFYRVLVNLSQRDTPLLARRMIQGLVGLRLPDDQWQREVLYWNSIALTHLQRTVIDYSTGQFAGDTSYINTTQSPHSQWLCQNQLIRGTRYQSFDFFTMMLVLGFGTFIIIAGCTLEDCVSLCRKQTWAKRSGKRHDGSNARRDMWITNNMFEMLRMVYTWRGHTTWSYGTNDIPVAKAGQTMTIQDLSLCYDRRADRHDKHVSDHELRTVLKEDMRGNSGIASNGSATPRSIDSHPIRTDLDETNALDFETGVKSESAWAPWDQFFSGYKRGLQRESQHSDAWEESLEPHSLTPMWPPAISYGRAF